MLIPGKSHSRVESRNSRVSIEKFLSQDREIRWRLSSLVNIPTVNRHLPRTTQVRRYHKKHSPTYNSNQTNKLAIVWTDIRRNSTFSRKESISLDKVYIGRSLNDIQKNVMPPAKYEVELGSYWPNVLPVTQSLVSKHQQNTKH